MIMNSRLLNAFLYRLVLISLTLTAFIQLMSSCSVDMCSREYSSVVLMSSQSSMSSPSQSLMRAQVRPDHYCSLLNAYNHCIRSIARSCRGNLEFHTIQTLLKNWKNHYNCTTTGNKYKPVTPIQRKSGVVNTQSHHNPHNWNIGGHQTPHLKHSSNEDHHSIHQQQRLQHCLSAAYNYTIYKDNETQFSQPKDERIKLLVSEMSESDVSVRTDAINRHNLSVSSRKRHNQKKSRKNRNTEDSMSVPVKAMKGLPLDDEDSDVIEDSDDVDEDSDHSIDSSVSSVSDLDSSNKVQSSSDTSPSISLTPHTYTPPSPPLTCIIYGDPHLRTFYSQYQTCKVLGAWPLIDHPLFAVQITNSRIKGMNQQITGVTKVTVLIRQFSKCGIFNDLLYEADSSSTEGGVPSLASNFIGGSSSTSNNLIRITTSSNNKVVTIHLDHIGVRVYIGQFASLNYLNVVIKFRSATSTVKQQLVLNSISENSLCKAGCPKRELIDIRDILRATSVNIDDSDTDFDAKPKQSTASKETADIDDSETSDHQSVDNVEDPCHGLRGYYRISCLYDLTIKGVNDVNNACRFAQSFDEMKSNQLSSSSEQIDGSIHVNIQSSKSCSNLISINIFLVIVIFLFCSYY